VEVPSALVRTPRSDHDGHVLAQAGDELQEPVGGETRQAPPQECRDLWLVHSQDLPGGILGELPPADDLGDPGGELAFVSASSAEDTSRSLNTLPPLTL
jgi:hypothetical protein